MPWYSDAGLLFYRKSLLEKYWYDKDNPPQTWADLEKMAEDDPGRGAEEGKEEVLGVYLAGEAPYEGLTCNALEWQASHGGGFIVDVNKSVDIREPTIAAFERAKGWIGWISPPDVLRIHGS